MSDANPFSLTKNAAMIAAFAALLAACSVLVIPLGPVPITLQTMAVALCGLYLGPKRGVLAVLLYILTGLAGAPVFAGGRAGLGVFLGPTGGYLVGFAVMAAIAGCARGSVFLRAVLLILAATAAQHLCGIAGLYLCLDRTLYEAVLMDLVFVPLDLVKAGLALLVWRLARTSDQR